MGDDIVQSKLNIGKLMRSVRTRDWSKFDRKKWDTVQSLSDNNMLELKDNQSEFLR